LTQVFDPLLVDSLEINGDGLATLDDAHAGGDESEGAHAGNSEDTSNSTRSVDPNSTLPSKEPTRMSIRTIKQPIWMQVYVSAKPKSSTTYPLSSYLSYDAVSRPYKRFFAKFSTLVELGTFKEVVQDPR